MARAHTDRTLAVRPGTSSTGRGKTSASSPRRSRTRLPRRWPGTGLRAHRTRATQIARRSLRLPDPREVLAGWVRFQAKGCAELGSPFYASLLESAAADLDSGGPVLDALTGFETESEWSAVPLRLMGGGHRLVPQGRPPQLGPHLRAIRGGGAARGGRP